MVNQIYYHFLSTENAIDDLENEWVKVGRLDSLNDPFEFKPYRRFRFKERQPFNELFRQINKKWGVLSFAKSWEKQLLWAHYADKHKGVALGFEIPKERILKVDYVSCKIRKKFKLTGDFLIDEQKFLELAKVKFQEWSHEKEYRLLVRLNNCKKIDKLYYLLFENGLYIKKIVLGCKFDHKNMSQKIQKLAEKLNTQIIPTREGWEDYNIHLCGTKTRLYRNLK